jgi:hypothetical protein
VDSDSGRAGSDPQKIAAEPSLASLSAISLPTRLMLLLTATSVMSDFVDMHTPIAVTVTVLLPANHSL